MNKSVKLISNFVSEDLSNWYIRRNRRRFWSSELDTSKKAVYQTTYEILMGVCKLMAPMAPFISEEIYNKLTDKSVHLADYPKCDDSKINELIESRMDLIRDLISLGRNVREETKIKVRQPISEVLIDAKNEELISDLLTLIEEELNVKKVTFIKDVSNYMEFMVKPNFKVAGPIFGPNIKEYSSKLNELSMDEITKLQNGETIKLDVNNNIYDINSELVDIRVSSKEGFNVATLNDNFIILDTNLTKDLILEGIAREMISKVQNIRKENDYNIIDRINLYYKGDEEVDEAVNKFNEFIKKETLAINISVKEGINNSYDLNGHEVFIETEKR